MKAIALGDTQDNDPAFEVERRVLRLVHGSVLRFYVTFSAKIGSDGRDQLSQWCRENCSGETRITYWQNIYFAEHADATLCMIRHA